MTTQKAGGWADSKLLIEPFDPVVGSSLLLNQLGMEKDDSSKDLAEEISESVGGLPLWLNQVGGFIQLSKCSLAEYIISHHASNNLLGGENVGENWRYEKAVSTVFDRPVKELSKNAAGLLYMLAYLNPDGIFEDMLLSQHVSDELDFLSTKNRHRYAVVLKSRGPDQPLIWVVTFLWSKI